MTKPTPEHLLKLISDAHPGLVAYINKNYSYEYVSQGYEKITFSNFAKKDYLQRSFERFERATSTPEVSGLGLSLFISREIVESHGGKIWVESEVDLGSTFFVCLPLEVSK
jgi:hypothetical protein